MKNNLNQLIFLKELWISAFSFQLTPKLIPLFIQ